MKKIILAIILLNLSAFNLLSQEKMAVVSFSGRNLSEGEGQSLLNIFTAELSKSQYRKDFILITRDDTALRTAYSELNYQRTAMLNANQMSKVGQQLGANWVFYGTVDEFNGASITINIVEVESSRIIATVNRKMSSIFDVNSHSSEMVRELISGIRGVNFVSKAEQRESSQEDLVKRYSTVKWVGRGMWIGGTATAVAGFVCLFSSLGSTSYVSGTYADPYANPVDINISNPLLTASIVCFVTGGILIAAGVPLDIIYGKKEQEARANLQYSFTPYILPDINGNMNTGVQFQFSYKF